ncbi:MAG TPA: outer membrane lipoprotein-sorting protein [Terriglobales bacterium]|nr:outer membrane lipoprotein-sorting protein [Terriglobales bacterium]
MQEIVIRLVEAQNQTRKSASAYVAERKYNVFKNESGKGKAEIMAEISFLPPGEKTFAIKQSSGGMPENVVRKALEHEASNARNPNISSITPENYDFELIGQEMLDGNQCFVMKIVPKRESKDLLKGKVWVDANRFMVRRAQGKPAKSPSFWVKDVFITLDYNDVAGVWLQTRSEATAKIRFAGEYILNSQHLQLRRAEVSADAKTHAASRNVLRRRAQRAENVASGIAFQP